MEKILVDSCIFIDIFRGNQKLYEELLEQEVSLSAIVFMELIQGSRNKAEMKKIEKFIKGFEIIPIIEKISRKSMDLIRKYSISHSLLIPDAIIAATAVINDLPLWTFNLRDFKFIEKLKLYEL